jgi:hypothetical protein
MVSTRLVEWQERADEVIAAIFGAGATIGGKIVNGIF